MLSAVKTKAASRKSQISSKHISRTAALYQIDELRELANVDNVDLLPAPELKRTLFKMTVERLLVCSKSKRKEQSFA